MSRGKRSVSWEMLHFLYSSPLYMPATPTISALSAAGHFLLRNPAEHWKSKLSKHGAASREARARYWWTGGCEEEDRRDGFSAPAELSALRTGMVGALRRIVPYPAGSLFDFRRAEHGEAGPRFVMPRSDSLWQPKRRRLDHFSLRSTKYKNIIRNGSGSENLQLRLMWRRT